MFMLIVFGFTVPDRSGLFRILVPPVSKSFPELVCSKLGNKMHKSNKNREIFHQTSMYRTILLIFVLGSLGVNSLHIKGTFRSTEFFRFFAKFGFQQTNLHDKVNTQGYIYGNITSTDNVTTDLTFVVVDSEYFLEFYGNRSLHPRTQACNAMFNKIDTIAWDYTCNPQGGEDFLRKIPCPQGKLCVDEDQPRRVVSGYQFTYAVQDTRQPRYFMFNDFSF